jgi:DNA polymerase III subunit epsilon
VTGLALVSEMTLVDRALARLHGGPAAALELCTEVLGLVGAPRAVAERVAIAVLGADPRVRQLPDGRWAILSEAQGSPRIEECGFAVIDLETTGMRARADDRITEVAVVLLHGERRELIFQSLVNPGRPIPPMISTVTGITNSMVANAPSFEAIADELLGLLAGRIFVAHNARFDWGFLDASFRRTRGLALNGPRLCTVRLARRLLAGVGSCGLDNLTLHFGFENAARHRAAGDAEVTAQLLERLLSHARGEGARTLMDLELIQIRRSRRRKRAKPSTLNL